MPCFQMSPQTWRTTTCFLYLSSNSTWLDVSCEKPSSQRFTWKCTLSPITLKTFLLIVCMPCDWVCAHVCVCMPAFMCMYFCVSVCVCVCVLTCARTCLYMIVNVPMYMWRPEEHCLAEVFLWDRIAFHALSWVIVILISISQILGLQVLIVPGLLPGCWWFRRVFSCLFSNQTTLTVSGISASCAKILTIKCQCLSNALLPRPPVFEFFSKTSSHWRTSCFSLLVGCFILYCPWQCDVPIFSSSDG